MQIETFVQPSNREFLVTTRFNPSSLENFGDHIYRRAIELIAKDVAAKFIEEHATDILKALDPVAIANLAIADSRASIREALHTKLPDKILEIVREDRTVYQRGIFGGMKRIG